MNPTLSSATAATAINGDKSRARLRPCSYEHPVMRKDDTWRDWIATSNVLLPRKGLSDVIPLATNGILVLCKSLDGSFTVAHLSNIIIIKPEPLKKNSGPKKEKTISTPRQPKRQYVTVSLEELL